MAADAERAADLPAGTVVGWGHSVLLKDADGAWSWAGYANLVGDALVDRMLPAATILRHGWGER